jgi:hypothetical protein
LPLGRAYSVESKPESENPLPQAYVEARHTLQVSPYNLSKRVIGDISFKIKKNLPCVEVQGEWYIDFNCTRKKKTKNQKEKEKMMPQEYLCAVFFFQKKYFLPIPCMYLPSPFTQSRHESTVLSL